MGVRKGILLAGGSGSRLYPSTLGVSKQLLPIGDKPLIYYSLSVLMLAGIREIILICKSSDVLSFKRLLGDGSQLGISIDYIVQQRPEGIAQAFLLAEEQIEGESIALVLGDNLFYGYGFSQLLTNSVTGQVGATIFGYQVADPERFGVIEFDKEGKAISIEEKPSKPKSNYAVTGLYFFDSQVVNFAKELAPSDRDELEITDIIRRYLENGQLNVVALGRGFAWLDTGTNKAMMDAGVFINAIEARQGVKVACLEEIAFRNSWIDISGIKEKYKQLANSEYGVYLKKLINEAENQ